MYPDYWRTRPIRPTSPRKYLESWMTKPSPEPLGENGRQRVADRSYEEFLIAIEVFDKQCMAAG